MLIRCTECNIVFPDSESVCPNCGKEVNVEINEKQAEECKGNWWIKCSDQMFVFAISALILATIMSFFMAFIAIEYGATDDGSSILVVGASCFILCAIAFVAFVFCQKKYGTADSLKALKSDAPISISIWAFVAAPMLLTMGILPIFEGDIDIGALPTIVGVVFLVIGVLFFKRHKKTQSKKSTQDTKIQEEQEARIRDFINSSK